MGIEYGLRMNGPELEKALDIALLNKTGSSPFLYVEIGVAEGKTLAGVAKYLSGLGVNFQMTGIDIEDGWSLVRQNVERNIAPYCSNIRFSLQGSPAGLVHFPLESIDFALIDGCHCYSCVLRDFFCLEDRIAPGGVVVFHDTCRESQEREDEKQHFGKRVTRVRKALIDICILQPFSFDDYPLSGWKLVSDVPATLSKSYSDCPTVDRGMVIVQKME